MDHKKMPPCARIGIAPAMVVDMDLAFWGGDVDDLGTSSAALIGKRIVEHLGEEVVYTMREVHATWG